MFKFLFGVAFGAAAYWAWQSFGRDLLGLGGDQETSYGGYTAPSTSTYTPPTSTSSPAPPSSPSPTSSGTPSSS